MNAKNVFAALGVIVGCIFGGFEVPGAAEASSTTIEGEVRTFVALLEERINSGDKNGVLAMCLPQATNQIPDLARKPNDRMHIELIHVDSGTNLCAKVCSYRESRPNRKQIVHIGLVRVENSFLISSAVDRHTRRLNAESERAYIATLQLALAINRQDTNEICRLTGIPGSICQGGGRLVSTALEQRNMGWVGKAMQQRLRVEYSGLERHADDDLRARLQEFGAGGVTNAEHVLQFKVDHFTHGEKDIR